MTPKEKAIELANKFVTKSVFDMTDLELINERKNAKKCALITVDEIIYVLDKYIDPVRMYWEEVKREIKAL